MRAVMLIGMAAVAAGLAAGAPGARPATVPEKTLASLTTEIEALKPPKLVWREVAWRKCLLAGLREAREQKKPVLLWAFINADPGEERC
jgi:hypothetical protein